MPSQAHGRGSWDTYVILRRDGWSDRTQLDEALERSATTGELMSHVVGSIRTYVLDERDGTVGTVCIVEADSPEAVRRHAAAAELPVDEIVQVIDTVESGPHEARERRKEEE